MPGRGVSLVTTCRHDSHGLLVVMVIGNEKVVRVYFFCKSYAPCFAHRHLGTTGRGVIFAHRSRHDDHEPTCETRARRGVIFKSYAKATQACYRPQNRDTRHKCPCKAKNPCAFSLFFYIENVVTQDKTTSP